uniref:ELMO domain-containing protein n=1 Tax=Globodera rostochiensis TaxID=31243 RepID=A0A914GQV9_GLORO
MSNFHLSTKVLNYIDTRPKENEVKGAIKLDANLRLFVKNERSNGRDKSRKEMATNIYATLDKQEPLSTFVAQISATLCLTEPPENYALMFEERCRFLTEYNKNNVPQGFFLTLTASPSNYAKHFLAHFGEMSPSNRRLNGVLRLAQIIEGFSDEWHSSELNSPPLFSLMRSLLTIMQHFPVLCPWNDISPQFVHKMALFVNGQSKLEQNDSRALALGTLLVLVERCDHLHECLWERLSVESLIRHLDNADERISLSSLSLINAIYELADRGERLAIIKILHERPFIAAIGRTLEKTRKSQPNAAAASSDQRELWKQLERLQHIRFDEVICIINEQLQHIRFDEVRALSFRIPSEKEIDYVLNGFIDGDDENNVYENASVTDQSADRSEFCRFVRSTPPGSLAVCALLELTRPPSPPHDGGSFRRSSLVTSAQLHQMSCSLGRPFWWPLVLAKLVEILIKILNICCPFSDSLVNPRHLPFWRLVLNNERPFYTLFQVFVELFQRTWGEMHAKFDDLAKVLSVVQDQMERAIEEDEDSVEQLEGELLRKKFSYFGMQKIWKKEEMEKEELELSGAHIQPLRDHLRPEFERMVLQLRINFLRKGLTFKRLFPQRLNHQQNNSNVQNGNNLQQQSLSNHFWFWRLDDRQRHFHFWDCRMSGGKHSELALDTQKKLAISQIRAVYHGNDLTVRLVQQFGTKVHKKAQSLFRCGLCLELEPGTGEESEYFLCSAGDESEFVHWLEGVQCLLWPQNALQKDSVKEEVDRLLSLEVQVRLMDVQQQNGVEEMPSLPVPDWPTDFSWTPTVSAKE